MEAKRYNIVVLYIVLYIVVEAKRYNIVVLYIVLYIVCGSKEV